MGLSARALADALDVSHTAVNNAAASGRITRGPDGTFDLEQAKVDWVANAHLHQQKRALSGVSIVEENPESGQQVLVVDELADGDESKFGINQIQRLIELEKLQKQRRENFRAAGQLLDRDEILRSFAQIGKIYGGIRESLPTQLATKLIGKTDLDEIETIIGDALREADLRICAEIESRALTPASDSPASGGNNGNGLVN